MKKRLVSLVTSALVGLSVSQTVSASYIAEDVVNLRSDMTTESSILAQLPYGTHVDSINWDCGGGWAHVNTDYGSGFILNSLLGNEDKTVEILDIANSYYSGTNKLIVVDTREYPTTYVFTGESYNWEPLAKFDCSIGAPNSPTPTGEFVIQNKRDMIYSGATNEYFVSDFAYDVDGSAWAFHSTLFAAGTWDLVDDRIGCRISNGCVRLHAEDAQWIWENCGVYTKIIIV